MTIEKGRDALYGLFPNTESFLIGNDEIRVKYSPCRRDATYRLGLHFQGISAKAGETVAENTTSSTGQALNGDAARKGSYEFGKSQI